MRQVITTQAVGGAVILALAVSAVLPFWSAHLDYVNEVQQLARQTECVNNNSPGLNANVEKVREWNKTLKEGDKEENLKFILELCRRGTSEIPIQ